jgi:transcriptional regulator with XRE-family HTH domain
VIQRDTLLTSRLFNRAAGSGRQGTAMRDSAFDPPALPDGFWARPDVRLALARRDMGELFRLLRQRAGISQTRIATATAMAQGRVSEIARDQRAVTSLTIFARIADGLSMPDDARACLGLAPVQPAPQPAAKPAPAPGRQPDQEAELLRRIASARNIDPSVVQVLQSETDAVRLLDRRLGAPAVAAKLEAHITHLQSGLRHSLLPGRRQQLAAVLADASALAGWQAIDMGYLPAAWDHFEIATCAAREASDNCLLAFAAGEQAYVLLDVGRPAEALDMARAAYDQTCAVIPHQVRAWLRAAEGEMAAAARQEDTCRRALDLAAAEISHGPSGEDLPYLALNTAHLARWRGNCLIQFGDPEASTDLTAALAAMDGSFTRAEAGLRCDLAAALHVGGEPEEARRHLTRASELAQITGSARQRRRITDLARRIGAAA